MSWHQFKDHFQNKRTPDYCQSWNIIRFAWCVVRIYLCKAVASHEAMVRVHPADNYAVGSHAAKHAHTHTHAYAQEGRADIWYMRAMINRLIGNGLIKFTLHIKTGSTHDSTYGVLECVYVTGCVCVRGPAPIRGGLNIFARQWSEPFPYLIAAQQSGRLGRGCLSPSQKAWDGERRSLFRRVPSNSSVRVIDF